MNILIIGKGAREHALCWKIGQSPLVARLFIADGNGGTAGLGENVALEKLPPHEIADWCVENEISLVVVGPEVPLVAGLGDALDEAGVLALAPNKFASQLEGSKKFTKDMCAKMNIPTAKYESFSKAQKARDYIATQNFPVVIKCDGLAGGKGVIIAQNLNEAYEAVEIGFKQSSVIVVEEFLAGREASMFFLCDGMAALQLATAQDYKRIGDGDVGANTGGMGAISPAPALTPEIENKVFEKIIFPTLQFIRQQGGTFRGILYAGLMINKGEPFLIEYNVRFGDPECQCLMMKMEGDIVPLLVACAKGELAKSKNIKWFDEAALTLIMAGKDYPSTSSEPPAEIFGLEETGDVVVFQGNTKKDGDKVMALGGRVLAVTGRGKTLAEARQKVYEVAEKINWGRQYFRRDIGAGD